MIDPVTAHGVHASLPPGGVAVATRGPILAVDSPDIRHDKPDQPSERHRHSAHGARHRHGGMLDARRPALRDEELGALRIVYSNASTQYVLLRSAPWPAALPKVSVDVSSLGLQGLVTPGQQADAAEAVGAYAGMQAVDDPSVFGFDAQQGALVGPTAPAAIAQVAHIRPEEPGTGGGLPAELQATFAPDGPHVYRSRFRVVVRRGDSFDFVLWGRGSLTGAHINITSHRFAARARYSHQCT